MSADKAKEGIIFPEALQLMKTDLKRTIKEDLIQRFTACLHPVRSFLFTSALAISVQAGQTPFTEDSRRLLLDVRKKVLETIQTLPNYICTETIERSMLSPAAPLHSCEELENAKREPSAQLRETESDRVRLDVAVSDDSETYSWVGENRFGLDLSGLVGNGATSSGSFITLLKSIFATSDARFTYNATVKSENRTLTEFGFVVPQARSGYSVEGKSGRVVVGYDGTFRVDMDTRTLEQLTVHVNLLPEKLRACDDTTSLTYTNVQLEGSDFRLPKSAVMTVIGNDGSELRNRLSFSGCRTFQRQPAPDLSALAGTVSHEETTSKNILPLPPDLPFAVALTQPIDTSKAAAGDTIQMRLVKAVRSKQKKVMVVEGTPVTARIVQIERFYGLLGPGKQSLRIRIKLESVEVDNIVHPIHAELESTAKRRTPDPDLMENAGLGGVVERMISRADSGPIPDEKELRVDLGSEGYLLFDAVTSDYVIPSGFEMKGKTR